jgi:acetylglutamate kinase
MTTKSSGRGGPIVLKLGGLAIDDPASNGLLWEAVAKLARSAPGGLVVVHGGGILVDRHLAALGIASERREGIRITPPEQVWEITSVLAGRVNVALVGALRVAGAKPVGVSLGSSGVANCKKSTKFTFDPGQVGEVSGGDGSALMALLRSGFLPVVSCIGIGDDGVPLNINADDAASGLALNLNADRLILLTDVAGIQDENGAVVPEISTEGVNDLITRGVITGGMIAKARAAIDAADRSGAPTVIASWKTPKIIADLARGLKAGTCVMPRRRPAFVEPSGATAAPART